MARVSDSQWIGRENKNTLKIRLDTIVSFALCLFLFAYRISSSVFGFHGQPVEVKLCDGWMFRKRCYRNFVMIKWGKERYRKRYAISRE